MLQRTTAILDKTVSYKAGGSDTSSVQRPKALHQLGMNYRWSSIVVDEQVPAEGEQGASTAAYRPEDPTVLRAGDRAPDAPGLKVVAGQETGETTALFSIYKPTRHTVLLFASNPEDVNARLSALQAAPTGTFFTVVILPNDHNGVDDAAAQSLPVDLVLVDLEGHAHTYYPPVLEGFTTIIIRPDAVVGAIVRSDAGVQKYLSSVFGA